MVKIDLTPPEVVVVYEKAEFVFGGVDSLTFIKLVEPSLSTDGRMKLVGEYLKEIRGLEDQSGNDVTPEKFFQLPPAWVMGVMALFFEELKLIAGITEDVKDVQKKTKGESLKGSSDTDSSTNQDSSANGVNTSNSKTKSECAAKPKAVVQ